MVRHRFILRHRRLGMVVRLAGLRLRIRLIRRRRIGRAVRMDCRR